MGNKANVLVGVASITVTTISGHPVGPVTIGYTTDGATLNVKSSFANIKVAENIGTILRTLTDQEVELTLNVAEGTLNNLALAIPGSSLTGSVITIGGDPLSEYSIVLVGQAPGGGTRTIALHHVNATGDVGIPFKKGDISVVPITFSCLVHDTGDFGTITDS
jgi:hypothetical protein